MRPKRTMLYQAGQRYNISLKKAQQLQECLFLIMLRGKQIEKKKGEIS